ncbi:MAG TPA: Uma2 family endonuclease [Pseudonocardiaceae bacterium]|nr:Uma2 family endonuclease [Pseudonocardiaceae bacterium]
MTDERGFNSRPRTVRDLEDMPDDGNRYELIDGELLVSPAPQTDHQEIVAELLGRLRAARPRGMTVLAAPLAVQLSDKTELQPDLLAAPTAAFARKNLPEPPSLAVEVISPSSVMNDLNRKKRIYERYGVPNYWVIDPIERSLVAFELDGNGQYQIVAKVAGDEPFEATEPFPIRFAVAELLGPFA